MWCLTPAISDITGHKYQAISPLGYKSKPGIGALPIQRGSIIQRVTSLQWSKVHVCICMYMPYLLGWTNIVAKFEQWALQM